VFDSAESISNRSLHMFLCSLASFICLWLVLKPWVPCDDMPGIKSLTFDEDKATLTVVGDVDVVEIVEALRKAKHPAVVDSVIDEKKEAEEKKKKEEEEKKKKKEEEEKKKKEEEEKKKKQELCARMMCPPPCPMPYPPYPPYCMVDEQPGPCTIV
jgi:ribosomal protein L12E/L44/L45/RPP1/RPP2